MYYYGSVSMELFGNFYKRKITFLKSKYYSFNILIYFYLIHSLILSKYKYYDGI